ncbi:MAG: hypothetical protein IT359_15850 [Gemmatimonadaceae bacterium]|nr:hypothetical protein [Gemmatimonadaceae bacterium]
MATRQPTEVQIRSYQVGFGDCFLLSFIYSARMARHVLIDFGTTELPSKSTKALKPSAYMPMVAEDIKRVCGGETGRLTAVVATHRHADHISGFGTDGRTGDSGSIIKALRPKLILQPWTEDPDAATDARKATRLSNRSRKGFVASLAAMHEVAGQVAALAAKNPPWMSAAIRKELSFIGQDNIANRSAIDNLIAMGEASGAAARYLHYGVKSGLDALLPGVKVHVLGPPDLTQTSGITKQVSENENEFWQLLAGSKLRVAGGALAGGLGARKRGDAPVVPIEGRWFRDRLERMRAQQLLEIVRSLDQQMNNTSVILLFEVFGKKLLFPGDAQLENWSYALQEAPDAERVRELLADVDVYKVGHHGSRNATPRKLLWEKFRKRKGRQLKTLLSTLPGKHGRTTSNTEVPRRTLLQALEEESQLLNTDDLSFGAQPELCNVLVVKPAT